MYSIPNISSLPYAFDIYPERDNIIIVDSNDDTLKLIRFENLLIKEDQTTFFDKINTNYNESLILNQAATDSLELIASEAESTERLTNVNHSYNILTPIDTGSVGTSGFTEKSVFQDGDLVGNYNLIKIPTYTVENIDFTQEGGNIVGECDPCANFTENGTICLEPGTFKIKCTVTISPEVIPQSEIPQNTPFNALSGFESIWSFISLYKLSSPKRFEINGDCACTYNKAGPSVSLNLLGFVYADIKSEYGILVHTIGKFIPGAYTSSILQSLTSVGSGLDFFAKNQITQCHLVVEKISDEDVLSPTKDSTQLRANRQFKYPGKPRLMYKSGWVTKINEAVNTPDLPDIELQKLKYLLFYNDNERFDRPIGFARVYFSDPLSVDGQIFVGDTVRYRNELPDELDVIPVNANTYDIRDSEFKNLSPGWYGYVTNESEKQIGEFYDAIFRVDNQSIVSSVKIP